MTNATYDSAIMAIRFDCPSCRQPIEVDDSWAGQSVACYYCRNVVTAPDKSTWPPGNIPTAVPASNSTESDVPATQWPSPPPHVSSSPAADASGHSAVWALVLSLTGGVLAFVGWMAWFASLAMRIADRIGTNATETEIQQELQKILLSGQGYDMPASAIVIFIVGLSCAAIGLWLAIRCLLTQSSHRVVAIIACIISVGVLLCQIVPMLSAMAASQMNSPS